MDKRPIKETFSCAYVTQDEGERGGGGGGENLGTRLLVALPTHATREYHTSYDKIFLVKICLISCLIKTCFIIII